MSITTKINPGFIDSPDPAGEEPVPVAHVMKLAGDDGSKDSWDIGDDNMDGAADALDVFSQTEHEPGIADKVIPSQKIQIIINA